ncbi:MAG: tetratricopeptide repeat protein [Candidatus Omnitrophota bacterium]|nr:tetratricopeptide repeat protein [Candidatus Omnitrophota bacterium]
MNEQELKEFYNKGFLAFEKQNYDYAVDIFSQILSVQYDHLEARHYLHLSLQKNAEGSKASITSSINKLFLAMQAGGLLKKGDIPAGLEALEKIIASNPRDSETLKKIADIFYKKGMTSHAINNLEEARLANPKDIDVFKKLGELYVKKEDYPNAKAVYESALKIDPNDTDVMKSLKNLDALGTMKREFGS